MKNDAERAQRLKTALRDNLRRRKAQTRGRAEAATENPQKAAPDAADGATPAGEAAHPMSDDPFSDKTAV